MDAAFVNLALHHVPDLQSTVEALARILKPGGTLVISDLLPHGEEWLREDQADLRLGLDPDDLAPLVRDAGFHRVRTEKGVDRLHTLKPGGRELALPLFVMHAVKQPMTPER